MSNTIVTPTVVAKEAMMQLENNCVMGNLVYRAYESEWAKEHNGWKPGSSLTIKAPMYARVKSGATIDVADVYEQSTTLTLDGRYHVAHKLTSEEMTYSIGKFSERIIKPAMVAIGNYIDTQILAQYKYCCNQVGTPGSTPAAFLTYALAAARLDDHAVPRDGNRHCVINPTAHAYLADHLKGLFSQNTVDNAVEQAKLTSNLAGFKLHMSQNVNNHTTGTASGSTVVLAYGAGAENATTVGLDTNGSWTLTLTAGDIFTFADVYAVNPISGAKLSYLRQFVCETHTDNGTDATINCTPGTAPFKIRSSSATETYLPYQTVDAVQADNAAVTVAGGAASVVHPVNLAFHRDSIALAMVPLEMPPSVSWKAQMSQNGYSVRVIRDFDVINDVEYIRFDVLFGLKMINPFMACRIAG